MIQAVDTFWQVSDPILNMQRSRYASQYLLSASSKCAKEELEKNKTQTRLYPRGTHHPVGETSIENNTLDKRK